MELEFGFSMLQLSNFFFVVGPCIAIQGFTRQKQTFLFAKAILYTAMVAYKPFT